MIHQDATHNAMNYREGFSFSDGNMVIGNGQGQVAIAYNNTPHNANQMTILQDRDALNLFTLLQSALTEKGLIAGTRQGRTALVKIGTYPGTVAKVRLVSGDFEAVGSRVEFKEDMHGSKWEPGIITKIGEERRLFIDRH